MEYDWEYRRKVYMFRGEIKHGFFVHYHLLSPVLIELENIVNRNIRLDTLR